MKNETQMQMTPQISDELYEFFRSWEEWRLNGAPNDGPYYRSNSLCFLAPFELKVELKKFLCFQFGNAGFVFGGCLIYQKESHERSMHLNPKRIAFVQRMISAYEAQKESSQ